MSDKTNLRENIINGVISPSQLAEMDVTVKSKYLREGNGRRRIKT